MDTLMGPATDFKVGDQVKMKGGCPHVWVVYAAWSPTAYHVQRWSDMTQDFVRETFIAPEMLIKV